MSERRHRMIQLNLNMKMPDKCSECKFFRVQSRMYCTAVVGYTTVSKPRKGKPAWCPLHEVTDSDTISRQAAIDALRYAQHRFTVADEAGGMGTVKWSEDVIYFAAAERILTELPSAQQDIKQAAKLLSDFIESCPGGDSYLITPDGEELRTDWGYAMEGTQLIHDWAERRTDG